MKQPLLIYTDYVAPACYLVEPVLASLGLGEESIERRPFELFPAPLPLPDFGSPPEAQAWDESIAPLAARLGVAMMRPARAVRTRKAHEAVLFARTKGAAPMLHRAVLAAYFAEGYDIGRVDVLVRLGEAAGLDRSELKVALDLDTYADEVAASTAGALHAGITGAPAFVRGTGPDVRVLVGYHEAGVLRDWLDGADRRGPKHERR